MFFTVFFNVPITINILDNRFLYTEILFQVQLYAHATYGREPQRLLKNNIFLPSEERIVTWLVLRDLLHSIGQLMSRFEIFCVQIPWLWYLKSNAWIRIMLSQEVFTKKFLIGGGLNINDVIIDSFENIGSIIKKLMI